MDISNAQSSCYKSAHQINEFISKSGFVPQSKRIQNLLQNTTVVSNNFMPFTAFINMSNEHSYTISSINLTSFTVCSSLPSDSS